ncbi:hypothetical protein ALC152_09110 [Arcobacter sp. 15-2]|uniref:hypothetical protein n=1 Tax=Arcobacter sp. 15-2 TaxID=3374109 RepID=UPI00399CCCDD
MPTELLRNFESSNVNKSVPNDKSSSKTEKKEGFSLFDSLVNEAKIDAKNDEKSSNNSIDKNTDTSDKLENKSSQEQSKQNISTVKQTTSQEVEKTKTPTDIKVTTEKNESSIISNEIKKSDETVDTKASKSLKTMVDKLVDIIVSSAKELFDKNDIKDSTNTQAVKNKINQILESKITGDVSINGLKSEVNKILDTSDMTKNTKELISTQIGKIIQSELGKDLSVDEIKASLSEKITILKKSIENIKEETKEIKDITVKSKENSDTDISVQKEKIVLAVGTIKEESDNIQKDLKNTDTENIKDSKKKDISQLEEEKKIVNTIVSKVDKIQKESSDIVSEIEKVKSKTTIELEKKENRDTLKKVDLTVDSIDKNIVEIEELSQKILVKTTATIENESLNGVSIGDTQNSKSIDGVPTVEKSKQDAKNPLLATMFLQNQKIDKEKTSLSQIKDAKNNIIEQKTVQSVKQSAVKLELNVEDTEITHEGDELKKDTHIIKKENTTSSFITDNKNLNKMFINQKAEVNILRPEQNSVLLTAKETSEIIEKDKKNIETVEITVAKDAVQVLQNKIIGAQQKMGSFMSEIARNMYLNYKPPVTAFRVNLNPANLGSISIIMRANKIDNTLNVSMNLSNSNTMESFIENKTVLQNAIQRQFNDSSNLTIDFGMQNQNSENSFNEHFNQDTNNQNSKDKQSEQTTEETIEEQEIIENNDYM